MSELEYILATDVRSIDNAKDALGNVVPENNPLISNEEYTMVMRILTNWRDRVSEHIKIK